MASMACITQTQQGVRSPSLCNERRNPHALPRPHIFTYAPFTRGGWNEGCHIFNRIFLLQYHRIRLQIYKHF